MHSRSFDKTIPNFPEFQGKMAKFSVTHFRTKIFLLLVNIVD